MMLLAAGLLSGLLPGLQSEGELFVAKRTVSDPGGRERVVVAADRRQVDCLHALRELTKTANWNLVVESTPLENDLRFASVDLNLADQDPRIVAQLIAIAAGADTVFHQAEPIEGARATLHVVRVPAAETESGRQRLRAIAGQWYRSFLRDELQYEPVVQREGLQVRMHLGQMLIDSGDLGAAISFFTDVYERRPHDHTAKAIVKIAQCHIDLANGFADRERQKTEYRHAEEWVRRLLERMPTAPEVTPATILLGKALLGQAMVETERDAVRAKAAECQQELRARVIRLLDSVELLEVWLLAGHAQFLMERPDRVHETMLTLRESPYFDDLGPEHLLSYHFLLGYGALGIDKPELAMRSLEWFLVHADNDARRGMAYVLLAESYLQQLRFVQARAAAVEARSRHLGFMAADWRERTLRVWARTALALGEKESAFLELEQMVLRGEEPELALFLVDELLADRQWQRAIAVARPMMELENRLGDRARYKTIQALYEQALASRNLDDFPQQAISLAPRVLDPELRSRVATMIGDAYTRLGKLEHAGRRVSGDSAVKPGRLVVATLALVQAVAGQIPAPTQKPDDVARTERALRKNRAEVDRLLDLRLRHDLGLPTDSKERVFRQEVTVTSESMEQMRRQLRDEDAATRALRERFDKARELVEQLRAEAEARIAREEREQTFVQVPRPGATPTRRQPLISPTNSVVPDPTGAMTAKQPAPAGETARQRASTTVEDMPLDPLRAQIHGSTNHQLVAQALFKAGQALMDRAMAVRDQGRNELARDLDDRGKERLMRAMAELQPMLDEPEPPYVALFYLGRCRELLFRYSERHEGLSLSTSPREFQQREQEVREPFLAISARDVTKTGERGEVAVLGAWGQAAQTAMEHFRWMNLHGGYDASATIEALTWPGATQK